MQPLRQAPRAGFETAIALPEAIGPYITVQALDASGGVLATAAAQKLGGGVDI